MKISHKNKKNSTKQHVAYIINFAAVLVSYCINPVALSEQLNNTVINDTTRPSQQPLKTPAPKPKEIINVPQPPKSAPQESDKNTIPIKKVRFTGNTAVTDLELQEIADRFLKSKTYSLTKRDLEELRLRITARYVTGYCHYEKPAEKAECPQKHSDDGYDCFDESYDNQRCENGNFVDGGYINSLAVIPEQSAANGELQIKIIEGNLSEVRLTGRGYQGLEFLPDLRADYLRDRLFLNAGKPLNLKDLQQGYQQLANDPLIDHLKGNLLPGSHPGESILTVDVVRKTPYKFYASADDYTTPTVGGYTGHIGGSIDNLTGFGEHIGAEFVTTGLGVIGFNTSLDLPLNAYDTHAIFRYNHTNSTLTEKPLDKLDIKTQISSFEGGLYHPFYRDEEISFTAGINFSVRKASSTLAGVPQSFTEGLSDIGTTQVSVLRLWQQYLQQTANNSFVMRSTFSKGLDVLGATIQHDKLLPSGEFFSWLGQIQYKHRLLSDDTQVVAKAAIQLATNPLLPMERFAVGGVYSVRGYRENFYVRDNGFFTGIEIQHPLLPWLGLESNQKQSLFLVPFMDYGGAWNHPTQSVLKPKKDYLHSVGIGITGNYAFDNIGFDDHKIPLTVAAELYWAHDLVGVELPNPKRTIQDNGIHFKISFSAF